MAPGTHRAVFEAFAKECRVLLPRWILDGAVKDVMAMDAAKVISAVLSTVNDSTAVIEYGHGCLVSTPLRFYDDDRVTLFVQRYEHGFRVSDQGTTAMRLHMADVNVDNPRIADAWRRSVAALGEFSAAADEGVICAWSGADELGRNNRG